MNYLYSAKANAFFPLVMQENYEAAGTWPEDGKEVPEEVFNRFAIQPPAGKVMTADKMGMPVWADLPPLTPDEAQAIAVIEQQNRIQDANGFMNNRQWPGKAAIGRLKGEDLKQYNAWLDYLDTLYATDTTRAPDINWPEKPAQ
ncbi:tail fiber assembly protein [Pantoea allii]|uniref:tail fiber assembly protein n=1 Tax=Pantoea allii TaxID=574096 RepID=UPI0024B871CE|nr:tail fiber assembly protein [Pantoea allii]MDJ0037346.1 tail fiber assembly protein [Pantoea allii]